MSKRTHWNEIAATAFTTISVTGVCLATVVTLMYPVVQVLGVAAP